MSQGAAGLWTTLEVWWVRARGWISMIVPLIGLTVMLIGAYGMINAGAVESWGLATRLELQEWWSTSV